MTGNLIWECDACQNRRVGFSKTELLREGWKFHTAGRNQWIIVCDACTKRHAERRQLKAAA